MKWNALLSLCFLCFFVAKKCLLVAVVSDDAVAYLRGRQLLISLEMQCQQRLINTNRAVRCVLVFEATVETLVPKATIAVAITWQLRNRHRYLANCAISITRKAGKLIRLQRWTKRRPAGRSLEMRRDGFRG